MTWMVIAVVMSILGVICSYAAYNNGVTDGYGYSKEPKNPGYQRAGEYLKTHMRHRWYELGDDHYNDRHSKDK